MSLEHYRSKRDFRSTPEPAQGSDVPREEPLRFVVQKHQATHLHYDLRLEADGVLKSWAVPKGPSLDPSQKKLAMMVEDHPFDYRDFEGIIPEGNYGAGTVMIWDEGTYHMHYIDGRQQTSQAMLDSIRKGNIAFFLEGQKLRGWFHLTHMQHAKQENSWLLFKKHDEFAATDDILGNDRSVRTGRTLEQIRDDRSQVRSSHGVDIQKFDLSDIAQGDFPVGPITPMFATLVDAPFDAKGWFFEIKWDGYRAIAELRRDSLAFYSRNGISFLQDYPPVVHDLRSLAFEAILDGEMVVVDEHGRSDFGSLQNYRRTGKGDLVYYVFDLLYLEGHDLRNAPLRRRKQLLRSVVPSLAHVRFNDHIEEQGMTFYDAASANGLEGVVAKDASSRYYPGERTRHWQKVKTSLRQEFVIGGFTEPRGGRTSLGALLVGVYEGDDLVYSGRVGGGFTDDDLVSVRAKLEPLVRRTCPFRQKPPTTAGATWIEPVLVGEVRFAEWTSEGLLRQPVFLGFREDLDPRQVRRETAAPLGAKLSLHDRMSDQGKQVQIDGSVVNLTNLAKVYWPDDHLTKGDMIDYYRNVAQWILPHLVDRPESLHRFPDGIAGKSFFHKDIEDAPDWARIVPIESDSQAGAVRYLLCQDEASLVFIVNLGALEINPWISRVGSLDYPDFCVIDLDPLDIGFEQVITTALAVREVLEHADIPGFVKTSGATGMHIFIPLAARYTYDQSRQFSNIICSIVNRMLPDITSLERLPHKRSGKVYLDFLQNTKGKTMAAPYSLRPRPGAPVSTPLRWDEVRSGLTPEQFTIRTTFARLEQVGDLFKPVLGKGIDMNASLSRLQKSFGEILADRNRG